MRPVNHKFFLTSPTQPVPLAFTDGVVIDATTGGLISSANNSATRKVALNGEKYLYFNVDYEYSGKSSKEASPFIQFYNSNNKILSTIYIGLSVIPVPNGAVYYAVNMCNDYLAYQFKDDNFFFLSLDEATPHYKKLTKKISKESNEMFYRNSLTGDITFHNKDFATISGMALTSKGMFVVAKADALVWYKQEFSKVDFEIDYFRQSAKLKIKTADAYTDVLAKKDRKFNITKIGAAHEWVYLRKKPSIQAYIMGGDTVSNFFSGVYDEADVTGVQDDFKTLVETNHFTYCQTAQEFEITGASDSRVNGVYAGVGGIYQNANGCEAVLYAYKQTGSNSSNAGMLYVYLPNGETYGVSNWVVAYNKDDFSGIDYEEMWTNYPQCIYLTGGSITGLWSDTTYATAVSGEITNVITSHILMRVLCDTPSIKLPSGTSKTTFSLPTEDFAYSGRNYNKVIGWESSSICASAITTSEPTEYGLNDYGEYFTDVFPTVARKVVPLCPGAWGNASIWWDYPTDFNALVTGGVNSMPVLIKHTYSLQTIISALLKKAGVPLLHTIKDSAFLYSSSDPTSRASDTWKNILIAPITNILKSDYTQAAQRGDISLEMIFEMLRKVFNCYWYIEGGHLKIEHLSFFINGLRYTSVSPKISIDLTTSQDQFNRVPYTYDQQKVSYDTKGLPSQYVFNYSEDTSETFTNVKLIMKNAPYADPSLGSEITVENFSADIDLMLLNPDNFNNDSFALLCPELVDNQPEGRIYSMQLYERMIVDDEGRSYKVTPQNLYASWLHLLRYHVDDIPSIQTENSLNVLINVIPTQKAFMAQSVKIPEALNIQPYQAVKTSVGTGLVESIDVELDTGVADIKLKHKPL